MPAEAAHAQCDNRREADAFEEENDVEHRHTNIAALGDGRAHKDDGAEQEGEEAQSWLHVLHQTDSKETSNGERSLGSGKQPRGFFAAGTGSGCDAIIDEEGGDGDLRARVAELSECGVEEFVLLVEGLLVGLVVGLLGLEGHVGVGNLRDLSHQEEQSQQENEDSDRKLRIHNQPQVTKIGKRQFEHT